jgi:hypothetical protein
LSAALIVFSVNCGKIKRTATTNTIAPATTRSATLRYVIVFHATWIPDLRFDEDTFAENLAKNLNDYAVIQTLPQASQRQKQVIIKARYLRV